ncbi:hypothetical protein [Flexivirga caeni]|uniref:Adenylate kinase n=1 Tax=Flexivirga caeni TaxID=2294115 RepID=A0A3M9MHV2_9MICO|nr:hypothetical protein [Flexivirga caeni]RNI25142.1 hypothetical protein EFY87_00365 [Flexivirga caeni]
MVHLAAHDNTLMRRILLRAKQCGRTDDTEDVIRHRLSVFASNTAPLLDFYDTGASFARIDSDAEIDEVYGRIMAGVAALAGHA